jgi:hypothetical protein
VEMLVKRFPWILNPVLRGLLCQGGFRWWFGGSDRGEPPTIPNQVMLVCETLDKGRPGATGCISDAVTAQGGKVGILNFLQ